MLAAGGDGTLLVGFKNEALRQYAGKTLAEVATLRGKSLQDTAMDLVVEDGSRVQVGLLPDVGGERAGGRSRCRG